MNSINDNDINTLIDKYKNYYTITPTTQIHNEKRQNILKTTHIELKIKHFLKQNNFHTFTTTFKNLHNLKQLPNLTIQHLIQQNYNFTNEND